MSDFVAKFADGAIGNGLYRDVLIEEHEGNPLIEALPAVLSKKDVLARISNIPLLSRETLSLPSEVRVQIVRGLERLFIPLQRHYTLESEISTLLRMSYVDRNNFADVSYFNTLADRVDDLKGRLSNSPKPGRMSYHPGGFKGSFFLCGMSGLGKTVAVSRILSLYPQLIYHSRYREQTFPYTQLVWLKLDCPHNSSVRGLCDSFFKEVDRVTGNTNFAQDYGGRTGPQMIPDVGRVAGLFGVGLLVIDEIQNLSLVRSSGAKQMLAFFTELVNTSGCAVLMIGTERAQEVLEEEFWQVRRNITSRPFHWKPFSNTANDNLVWTKFLETFWDYQYTTHKVELSSDLINLFHHETMGIPDFVVKLFVGVQQVAIEDGGEKITSDLVKEVASTIFAPAQAAFAAYRLGKKGARENLNEVIREMDYREAAQANRRDGVATPTPTLRAPVTTEQKRHVKSRNKKAHQSTGLIAILEELEDGGFESVYEAFVAKGYVAPKDEFLDAV